VRAERNKDAIHVIGPRGGRGMRYLARPRTSAMILPADESQATGNKAPGRRIGNDRARMRFEHAHELSAFGSLSQPLAGRLREAARVVAPYPGPNNVNRVLVPLCSQRLAFDARMGTEGPK